MLINNISDIREFVPVNPNMGFSQLSPYIEQATVTYLIPDISQDEYDTLEALYTSQNMTPVEEQAVRLCQAAICNYALFLASPFLNVMVSNQGIQEQRSLEGTSQSSSQWRYTEFRSSCLLAGDQSMDALLAFMELNKTDFQDWVQSPNYTVSKSVLISDAGSYPFGCISSSRRTYLRVRPHIAQAQEKWIRPALGDALYNELTTQYAADNLSSVNQLLYTKVVHALAHLTLADAIPHLTLNLNASGIVVTVDMDANKMSATASMEMVNKLQRSHQDNGDLFLLNLQKFVYSNADDYPLFVKSPIYDEDIHRRYHPTWFIDKDSAFDSFSRNAYRNDFSV
jgi:hypothetical protein